MQKRMKDASGRKCYWRLVVIVGVLCTWVCEPARGEDQGVDREAKPVARNTKTEKKRNSSGVEVTISVNRTKFGPGEPIVVTVSTKNTGKVPFWCTVTSLSKDVRFTVYDLIDTEIPLTRKGRATVHRPGVSLLFGGPKDTFKVDTGELLEPKHAKHTQHEAKSLIVNVYYDMTMGGRYKIKATRRVQVGAMNAKSIDVESNTIEIMIAAQFFNPCCLEKPKKVKPKP